MVEFALKAVPRLGGCDISVGQNSIVERDELALVSIAIPLDGDVKLHQAIKKGWKLGPPTSALSTVNGNTRALPIAADQLMLLFAHQPPDANAVVQQKLKGAGYTTDQTDNWVVLQVEGPDTVSALARICALDLHLSAFPINASGRTIMEHMGAFIIRLDEDAFLLISARSSADSFLHAVTTSYQHVVD